MKTTIKIAILFIVANVYSQTPYPDQIRFKPFVIVKDSTQIEYGEFYWNYEMVWDHEWGNTKIGSKQMVLKQDSIGVVNTRVFKTYIIINNDSILIDEKHYKITDL